MFPTTIKLYKDAYSGLSRETWWLSITMLINRSGTMVVPFLTLYLTRPAMGYSISEAGIVLGLFGLGAVIGAHISGRLVDKMGFYSIQLFTLFTGGLLFIVLGQMKTYSSICIVTFLLSFVNEAFRPANSTAIAFYSKEVNRTRSYSLNRLAINLGWAVGNALGGFIASFNYELLFWFDGITNMAAAVFMFFLLSPVKNGKVEKKKDKIDPAHAVYKDKIYLWFVLLVMLFAACFFQLFTNLSAYYRNELHFSERFIGLTGAINGLLIVLIEMVIVFRLEGKRNNIFYIMQGVFLCGISFLILAFFPTTYLMAIVMVLIMTFGEMLSMPFMNSFWISRSKSHNRGSYAALYTIAWAFAQTVGPVLGSQMAEHAGFTALWFTVGILLLITAFGFAQLNKKLKKQIG